MEVTTDYNGVDGATSDYNYHSSNINSSNNYNNNNINNANNKNSNYNKKNNNSKRHSSLSRHNRTSNSNNIINNKQKDKRIEPTKSDEVQQQVRNLIDNTLSNNFLIIKLVNALKKDLEHQKCSIVTVLTMKELLQSEQQENCTACLMNYSLSIKVLISAIQLHPIKYDSHITVVLEIFILLISRNSYYKVVLISNRVVRIVVNMIETVKSRKLISLAVQLLSDLLLSHTFWRDVSIPNVDFSRIYQGSLERSSLSTDEGDSVNSKIGVDFSEKEDSHSLVDSDQHSEGYLRIVDSIPFDILRLLRSPREVTKRGGLKLLLLILDSSIATRSLFNDDNSVSQTGNRKYDDSSRNYKDSVGGGFDEWKSSLIAQLALVLLDANAVNTQFEAIEIAIKLHSYTKLHSNCTNVNNFLVILQEIIGTVAVLKLSVDGKSILHSNQFCLKAYRDNTTTRTRTSSGVSKRKSSRLRQYYDCMINCCYFVHQIVLRALAYEETEEGTPISSDTKQQKDTPVLFKTMNYSTFDPSNEAVSESFLDSKRYLQRVLPSGKVGTVDKYLASLRQEKLHIIILYYIMWSIIGNDGMSSRSAIDDNQYRLWSELYIMFTVDDSVDIRAKSRGYNSYDDWDNANTSTSSGLRKADEPNDGKLIVEGSSNYHVSDCAGSNEESESGENSKRYFEYQLQAIASAINTLQMWVSYDSSLAEDISNIFHRNKLNVNFYDNGIINIFNTFHLIRNLYLSDTSIDTNNNSGRSIATSLNDVLKILLSCLSVKDRVEKLLELLELALYEELPDSTISSNNRNRSFFVTQTDLQSRKNKINSQPEAEIADFRYREFMNELFNMLEIKETMDNSQQKSLTQLIQFSDRRLDLLKKYTQSQQQQQLQQQGRSGTTPSTPSNAYKTAIDRTITPIGNHSGIDSGSDEDEFEGQGKQLQLWSNQMRSISRTPRKIKIGPHSSTSDAIVVSEQFSDTNGKNEIESISNSANHNVLGANKDKLANREYVHSLYTNYKTTRRPAILVRRETLLLQDSLINKQLNAPVVVNPTGRKMSYYEKPAMALKKNSPTKSDRKVSTLFNKLKSGKVNLLANPTLTVNQVQDDQAPPSQANTSSDNDDELLSKLPNRMASTAGKRPKSAMAAINSNRRETYEYIAESIKESEMYKTIVLLGKHNREKAEANKKIDNKANLDVTRKSKSKNQKNVVKDTFEVQKSPGKMGTLVNSPRNISVHEVGKKGRFVVNDEDDETTATADTIIGNKIKVLSLKPKSPKQLKPSQARPPSRTSYSRPTTATASPTSKSRTNTPDSSGRHRSMEKDGGFLVENDASTEEYFKRPGNLEKTNSFFSSSLSRSYDLQTDSMVQHMLSKGYPVRKPTEFGNFDASGLLIGIDGNSSGTILSKIFSPKKENNKLKEATDHSPALSHKSLVVDDSTGRDNAVGTCICSKSSVVLAVESTHSSIVEEEAFIDLSLLKQLGKPSQRRPRKE